MIFGSVLNDLGGSGRANQVHGPMGPLAHGSMAHGSKGPLGIPGVIIIHPRDPWGDHHISILGNFSRIFRRIRAYLLYFLLFSFSDYCVEAHIVLTPE